MDGEDGYYITLENTTNGKISFTGDYFVDKDFTTYYLKDDRLGMPGHNKDTDGAWDDDKKVPYPTNAADAKRNDDGSIYIFLDPTDPWKPTDKTFDLTMKKRWDGHNSDGVGIRPNEKVIIQLQRWTGEKWVEYNHEYFPDDKYVFTTNLDVYDSDTNEHGFVHRKVIGDNAEIECVYGEDGTCWYETSDKQYKFTEDQLYNGAQLDTPIKTYDLTTGSAIELNDLAYDTLRKHGLVDSSFGSDKRVTVKLEDEKKLEQRCSEPGR